MNEGEYIEKKYSEKIREDFLIRLAQIIVFTLSIVGILLLKLKEELNGPGFAIIVVATAFGLYLLESTRIHEQ